MGTSRGAEIAGAEPAQSMLGPHAIAVKRTAPDAVRGMSVEGGTCARHPSRGARRRAPGRARAPGAGRRRARHVLRAAAARRGARRRGGRRRRGFLRRLRPRDPVHGRASVPRADPPARRLRARRLLVRLPRRALRRSPPRAGAFMRGGPAAARGRKRYGVAAPARDAGPAAERADPRVSRRWRSPTPGATAPGARSTRSACAATGHCSWCSPAREAAGRSRRPISSPASSRPVVSGGDVQVLLHAGPADAAAAAELVRAVESPMLTAGVAAPARPGRRPVDGAGLSRRGLRGEPSGRGGGRARRHPLPGGHVAAVGAVEPHGAAHPDGAGRRRGIPGRGRRRGGARRGYFCLAMIMPLILSYVALGTIFFWTSSSLPLYGRPSMIFLA